MSSEAMICRFGEVLVWVKNASLNVASVLSQQSSFDHDVGTLAEAGERLVRRGRGIDAQLHRVGIRQQMRVEQLRILRIESCRASF